MTSEAREQTRPVFLGNMANYGDAAGGQSGFGTDYHQSLQMRDFPFDVITVRAHQTGNLDEPVINPQVVAAANQPLGQPYERRLAEVVGALLERQSEQA